jgi:hypothetical protein
LKRQRSSFQVNYVRTVALKPCSFNPLFSLFSPQEDEKDENNRKEYEIRKG